MRTSLAPTSRRENLEVDGHAVTRSWSRNSTGRGACMRQEPLSWLRPRGSSRKASREHVTIRVHTVARGGVEPPTFRFSVGRSYQLSYLAE